MKACIDRMYRSYEAKRRAIRSFLLRLWCLLYPCITETSAHTRKDHNRGRDTFLINCSPWLANGSDKLNKSTWSCIV